MLISLWICKSFVSFSQKHDYETFPFNITYLTNQLQKNNFFPRFFLGEAKISDILHNVIINVDKGFNKKYLQVWLILE